MNNGEMKVSDVRNWVLNNMFNQGRPSKHDVWFADMLEKNYSTGIPGVAVECADIRRNTNGEGRSLGHY